MKIDQTQDFAAGFFKQMQNMKELNYLTDFKLRIKEDEISCHKVVLSAVSQYFHALFRHGNTVEVAQGFVEFDTLHFPALVKVVEYCYSGVLEFNMDDAKHLIEVADYLLIVDLTAAISVLVTRCLTADNCIGWSEFANYFGLTTVKEKAREIMLVDFPSVIKGPEFFSLDYGHLIDYISWNNVDVSCALIAGARWVAHNIPQRQEMFPTILKTIDISRCSQSSLKYVMDTYGTQLITSVELLQQFTAAGLSNAADWQEPGRGVGFDVFILGGFSRDGDNTQTCSWMINLKTGVVVDKASFPAALRGDFVPVCSVPQGAFLVGIASKCALVDNIPTYDDQQTQCVLYQKQDDTWALLPDSPRADVVGASTVCLKGTKVYIMGGLEPNGNKMHSFDVHSKSWNECPDLLQGLAWPIVGSVENCIYVISSTVNEITAVHGEEFTLQCFDATTSSWVFKQPLPADVIVTVAACTVSVSHRLYVIGGTGDLCLYYDTTSDSWTKLTAPLQRHSFGAAMYLQNKIILTGGQNSARQESDVVESYDPETDTWEILPVKLPKPLWMHCMIARH